MIKILLSIKPEYAKKIFSGEKKYEFRKQTPKQKIEWVLVYESHPSKKIVGWFSVRGIISGSPKEIWVKCKDSSGVEMEEYFKYCNGKRIIYALQIDKTLQFDIPINPFETDPDFKPPQNFSYLNNPMSDLKENVSSMANDRSLEDLPFTHCS